MGNNTQHNQLNSKNDEEDDCMFAMDDQDLKQNNNSITIDDEQQMDILPLSLSLLAELLELSDLWLLPEFSKIVVDLIGNQLSLSNLTDFVSVGALMSQDVLRDPHPLLVKCVAYLRANLDWFLCSAQFRRMSDDAIDALDQMLFRSDDEDASDTDDDVVSQRHDDEAYYRGSNVVVKKTIAGIERRLRLIGKAKLACLSEINARLERRYRFWKRVAQCRTCHQRHQSVANSKFVVAKRHE